MKKYILVITFNAETMATSQELLNSDNYNSDLLNILLTGVTEICITNQSSKESIERTMQNNHYQMAFIQADEISGDFEMIIRDFGFRKCDACGKWINPARLSTDSVYMGEGVRYCNECYEKKNKNKIRVNGYHQSGTPSIIQLEDETYTLENVKGYGIEMELDRAGTSMVRNGYFQATEEFYKTNKSKKYFRFERDGSLTNGVEFISNIFTSKALKVMDWSILTNQMKALGADDSKYTSGFHIHVSKAILGETPTEQALNALKIMYFINAYQNDFLTLSGRDPSHMSYCNFYSKEMIINTARSVIARAREENSDPFYGFSSSHAYALISSRNTIEFRFFKSTSDPEKIKHIMNLISGICENIKNVRWSKIYCMGRMFKGIEPSTMQYLHNHGLFLRTIATTTKGEEMDLTGLDTEQVRLGA